MAYGGEYGCTDKDNCNLGRHDDGLTSPEKEQQDNCFAKIGVCQRAVVVLP